jgi:tetratricopeptide (TPR) repeat protein
VIGFAYVNVSRTKLIGIALAIFAATASLYWPCTHDGFLRVDDQEYLGQSMRRNGLTWNAVKWAFTTTEPYYQALPRLSHIVDYQIWGKNAAGHHATSVILHALNAALVFGFLWTLLGATSVTDGERLAVALWVAVVFAIHPLQVESVAWMSGRTQLLCATFGISCLWAYAAGKRWPVVLALFVLALLSKPMAVSFPFVMVVMDYYPLRRYEESDWTPLLWEKAPLFAIALAASLVTIGARSQAGEMGSSAALSAWQHVLLWFGSLMFYPWKLIWPSHLSPDYPIPLTLSLAQRPVLLSIIGVTLITTAAIVERRRMPMLAAAWAAYAVLILPMSGIVLTTFQAAAPRYAYVAMLPLLLILAGMTLWMWRRLETVSRGALTGLLACGLCLSANTTRRLIPEWRDDETMRRAAVAEFPDSEETNRTLAQELLDQGRAGEALPYAQRAVEVTPQAPEAHVVLGFVLAALGRLEEGISQYEDALQIDPHSARADFGLGVALLDLGKVPEAAKHFERALQIKPGFADAHLNLGYALYQMGRVPEAIKEFEATLSIDPDRAEAHNSLGGALLRTSDLQHAIAEYEEALRLQPDYAEAHYNLGIALAQAGRVPEAIKQWEQVLRLKPDHVEAHYNLGCALEKLGRVPEAIVQFQQALKLRPDFTEARDALARLGANQGRQ